MGAIHRCQSLGRDTEETFRPSAALGGRFAKAGLDVPFCLQAIKGGIDCADGHLTVSAEFDLLPHGDSIGSIFQPQERQNNDVLEFAEIIARGHYLYNIEES